MALDLKKKRQSSDISKKKLKAPWLTRHERWHQGRLSEKTWKFWVWVLQRIIILVIWLWSAHCFCETNLVRKVWTGECPVQSWKHGKQDRRELAVMELRQGLGEFHITSCFKFFLQILKQSWTRLATKLHLSIIVMSTFGLLMAFDVILISKVIIFFLHDACLLKA